jgi:hypothetical protein
MIKYAFIKVGVATTDYSRFVYYNSVKFNVGGHVFSFQDWESGILRGNRKAPYVVGLQLKPKDPRLALTVKKPDCRIHFGLNCGARSCPPVRNFSAENLEEELRMVATSFCEDNGNIHIDTEKCELHLSQIFSWYRVDFAESNHHLPKALGKHMRGTKQQTLERLLEGSKGVKVQFMVYDWSHNASRHIEFDAEHLKANSTALVNLLRTKK